MRRHGNLLSLYRPCPQHEPIRRRDSPPPPRRERGADDRQRKAA